MTAIPKELRDLRQWVRWREELPKGAKPGDKPTKVPYQAVKMKKASSTDPASWNTYDQAVDNLSRLPDAIPDGKKGVGFMFTEDGPHAGVDMDHVRDPESGAIASWARKWVDKFSSYSEVSPNGDGLHVILKGKKCYLLRNTY